MLFHIIISVFPMFVCLFGVILFLMDRRKNLPKRYLAAFLLISAVNYFVHATYFGREYSLYAFWENIWVFTSLASYPLYYYYVRLLTHDRKIDLGMAWILLPSILLSVFSFVLYFLMTPQELDIFVQGVMYHRRDYLVEPLPRLVALQKLRLLLFKIVFALQVLLSVFFGLRSIIAFNREVKEFYSNTAGKDMHLIKWVFFAFLVASLISSLSNLIGKEFFVDNDYLLTIPSVTHSLFLFLIIIAGYRQNFTIDDFMRDMEQIEHNTDKELVSLFQGKRVGSNSQTFVGSDKLLQLTELIEEKQLFRNPDLRITDLSEILGSNRTYVSRIVNEGMRTNFCDWVNGYRINYAVELLQNPQMDDISLAAIAEMSGFSSVSVFYRVFKQKKGVPPGKFRGKEIVFQQ